MRRHYESAPSGRRRFFSPLLLAVCLAAGAASAGDASGPIPQTELQALDRAIARELNSNALGSQTLGDLSRLKNRLSQLQTSLSAPQPGSEGGDSQRLQLERLEAEAQSGGRAALRSLALYNVFLGEPERALALWKRMGRSGEGDISHFLIAAYLELALGEYNSGRRDAETALRLMDSRTSLGLSTPIFCDNIGGYRIYSERKSGSPLPGEDVLIYVEIEGAEFAAAPEGGSECDVMFGLKLKNEAQHTLWAESNYGRYAPLFAGPIRDLHAALSWRIPNDLEPGRYHLFVEAVEEPSKRRGESVLAFSVGKRETNPEKRPGGGMAPPPSSIVEDARRIFQGGLNAPAAPGSRDSQLLDGEKFDILRRYHQQGRIE